MTDNEKQRIIVGVYDLSEGGMAWRKIRYPRDEERCGNRVFADAAEYEDRRFGSYYTRIRLFDSAGRVIWDIPKHSVALEYADDVLPEAVR